MSTSRGNAEHYATDHITVSGREMAIGINEAGYYIIKVAGAGEKPPICDQIFTSLGFARKALNKYTADNAEALAKEKFKDEMASKPSIKEQRKAERLAARSSE